MKKIYNLLCILFLALVVNAQTTIVLQPGSITGMNAEISNYPSNVNSNYGGYGVVASYIWTNGIDTFSERALLQFDLSSIPSGATITSAYLDLYASPPGGTFGGTLPAMNGSDNASYVRRITQPWNAYTVTWNNQPNDTDYHQIILPTSTSGSENYPHNDVKQLVKDMMTYGNNGFMIEPVSTEADNSMLFNSCNFADTTQSPRLTITYTVSTVCLTLRPGSSDGKSSEISNYPSEVNTNYGGYGVFASYIWSSNEEKALVAFDLSSIPSGATVTSALLDLYADSASTTFNVGVAMYGTDNASYLRRVTQPWGQNTVTWNNQPTDTTMDQVILPTSTSPNQNYLGVDVSQLIQDMLTYGNNGFMIEPVSTTPNNAMIFRSSGYPDSSYRPQLSVCYTVGTAINNVQAANLDAAIYPNPFNDQFTIKLGNAANSIEISVCNVIGQNIFRRTIENPSNQITISRSELSNVGGLLFVTITSNNTSKTFKLVANQ